MPSKTLWDAAVESQGTVLTTQLDALGDAAWSALGSEYDNTADLIQYFKVRLAVDTAVTPISTVIEAVLKAAPVADISLEDPPLEEVIARIYTNTTRGGTS